MNLSCFFSIDDRVIEKKLQYKEKLENGYVVIG